MTDKVLSEEDFQFFKQLEYGDLIDIVTRKGEEHTIKINRQEENIATGVCLDEPYEPVLVKLRGGRGRGNDKDQPYVAIGYDQDDVIEPVFPEYVGEDKRLPRPDELDEDQDISELGDMIIGGIGPVELNEDQTDINYTAEVISIEAFEIPDELE